MPKNKRYRQPFINRRNYSNEPVFQFELNNDGRELGIRCQRCTRILTYYHPKPGDLCPICRRLDRNSKIRRGKRQGLASHLELPRNAPLEISNGNAAHGNIFQNNDSFPQGRFPVSETWERRIYPTPSYSVEKDPNYFSFESPDRNNTFKFDNDLQISSHSNQSSRNVQIKPRESTERRNNTFPQPFTDPSITNKGQINRIPVTAPVDHMRGFKRKENFEDVSLKRLRPTILDSPVPVNYELTRSIWQYYAENVQTDEVFNAKMELRDRLEHTIQERFPGSELFVFGSSMTGYGTKTCDVDVCLMFHDFEVKKKNAVTVLWELKRLFSKQYFLIKLQVIQARVPILKFKDSLSGFDVDLNINNPTGIRNSQLLRSYARIDERVRPLILAIKLWARSHDINDARTGTLSSYCLGLMLIHYLQYRCSPPVLPCLQTLQPDKYQPDADVRVLKVNEELPMFRSSNNESVGNLFAGFIRYYSMEYDYCACRISVRLGCLLQRVEKRRKKNNALIHWIDIEEPFEQTNAARSTNSPKVYAYIKTVFDSSCNRLNQCGNIYSLCN